jgi:hypothetical protein
MVLNFEIKKMMKIIKEVFCRGIFLQQMQKNEKYKEKCKMFFKISKENEKKMC